MGKIVVADGKMHLCGSSGDEIKCFMYDLSSGSVDSFNLKDNDNIYQDPEVMTMLYFFGSDTGVAFNFKSNVNNQYLHGFMRWDNDSNQVVFMATLSEQSA